MGKKTRSKHRRAKLKSVKKVSFSQRIKPYLSLRHPITRFCLLFLVLMNAAIFIASKMIMAKTGANLLNMVNGMNSANFGGGASAPSTSRPAVPKRKMKGPSFRPGDI